jgi:hypothetical protein
MTKTSRLQVQLEANLGPDPINPCASLSGIAAKLYDRMFALAVEQERLKIQYRHCLQGIDNLSAPAQAGE